MRSDTPYVPVPLRRDLHFKLSELFRKRRKQTPGGRLTIADLVAEGVEYLLKKYANS